MTLRPDAIIDYEDDTCAVIRHDARTLPLEDGSVDLIVTSPPYFALRSYRDDGEHFDGQIGSEDTPDLFLDALDECMVEWGRVLKPTGSVWINLGDKYAGSGGNDGQLKRGGVANPGTDVGLERSTFGFRTKTLMGLPWRFAIRQIDAGWILRAEVIWDKPNSLPESVTDRVRRSHEQWFHMVKEPRYFSGIDEIREPQKTLGERHEGSSGWNGADGTEAARGFDHRELSPLGRLPGSVWTIPSEPLLIPDDTRKLLDLPDHFAAFPQEFPRRIITGWSPTGICTVCGEGRRPVVDGTPMEVAPSKRRSAVKANGEVSRTAIGGTMTKAPEATITGYACSCWSSDEAGSIPSVKGREPAARSAVVLDPFGGTGTVAGVARTLGRFGISNDLSESYNRLAIWRITQSGHFTKTEQRAWADRQGQLL